MESDVDRIIPAEYNIVNAPTRLGDIILLVKDGKLIHSCVCIAGDVVFTKNGVGNGMPFVFERLDDVISYYQEQWGTISTAFCRRKGLPLTAN